LLFTEVLAASQESLQPFDIFHRMLTAPDLLSNPFALGGSSENGTALISIANTSEISIKTCSLIITEMCQMSNYLVAACIGEKTW